MRHIIAGLLRRQMSHRYASNKWQHCFQEHCAFESN